MKNIIYLLPIMFLLSCGPSAEEIETMKKIKADSIAAIQPVIVEEVIQQPKIQAYFTASDFNLIPGKIVGWAPTDEVIEEFKSNGGDKADREIYIHIQSETGKITIMECDVKAWINLHTGDILK